MYRPGKRSTKIDGDAAREMRDKLEGQFGMLKDDRQQHEQVWSEIRNLARPGKKRFHLSSADHDEGDDTFVGALDAEVQYASRTLRAGLHGGLTPPSRKWFNLKSDDPDLNQSHAVSQYFHEVERRMMDVLAGSNFYSSMQTLYGELGNYGQGPMLISPNRKDVIRCYSMEIGEYWLGADEHGVPNTVYRKCRMTIDQIAREFGLENLSHKAREAYDRGDYYTKVTVVRAVTPRREKDGNARSYSNRNMPFLSAAWEEGSNKEDMLRVSGVDDGALVCPRWMTAGYDAHGVEFPGLSALPSARVLEYYARRKAEFVDLSVRPPMQAPAIFQSHEKNFVAGGISFVDDATLQRGGLKPIFEAKGDIGPMTADIADERRRVNQGYFSDIFMMFQNPGVVEGVKPTAAQIHAQHEEKLTMLGPVLGLVGQESLDPSIGRTYSLMAQGGLLPEAPIELQGKDIKIEYVSPLAQAQKAVGVGAIERHIGMVGTLAELEQAQGEAAASLDIRATIEEFADMIGTPPTIMRSKDDARELLKAEAEGAEQAQMMAAMQPAAQSAKLISEAAARGQDIQRSEGVL
jgi:hypothetical protein